MIQTINKLRALNTNTSITTENQVSCIIESQSSNEQLDGGISNKQQLNGDISNEKQIDDGISNEQQLDSGVSKANKY